MIAKLVALALVGGVALGAATARAETDAATERARRYVQAAAAHYDEGRYDEALREMESAYRTKPLPAIQYNMAQCHERLGHPAEAAAAYRLYLAGHGDAEDAADVRARVANLEARAARERAGAAAPPPRTVERVVLKEVTVYREKPPLPGRGARFAAYGLGVVALGALAAGITFSVLAARNADAVTSGGSAAMPVPFTGAPAEAQAAGQTDQVVAGIGYGVAGVAAVGAVGLYLLGARIDREAPALALAPSLGPSRAGLAFAGRF